MRDEMKTVNCICEKQGCWHGTEQGIPSYCQANNHIKEIDRAKNEYKTPDVIDIYKAACVVGARKDGLRPRIEEALDFAKELKLSRIGFASCTALAYELRLIMKLFKENGFAVFCVGCQIGRVTAEDRGIPEFGKYVNSTCNPIAQAEILNSEGTQLNFILGLCIGHDILFNRYSSAPVSTLIVKDRLMGNNPVAVLHGWHARRALFGMGRMEDREI